MADGLVWDVPLKAHASGDYSIAVAQANEALEDQAQVLAAPGATLVGVYDGHGGPEAARFVNRRLFSLIQGELPEPDPWMISLSIPQARPLLLRLHFCSRPGAKVKTLSSEF